MVAHALNTVYYVDRGFRYKKKMLTARIRTCPGRTSLTLVQVMYFRKRFVKKRILSNRNNDNNDKKRNKKHKIDLPARVKSLLRKQVNLDAQSAAKSLFNTSKHTTTLLKVHELLKTQVTFSCRVEIIVFLFGLE